MGLIVPSALDTCTTATILVRSVSSRSYSSSRISPASSTGATRSRAPFSAHTICQGTRFEWCSIAVTSTSSPGPSAVRP
jgi:hypothetical protein